MVSERRRRSRCLLFASITAAALAFGAAPRDAHADPSLSDRETARGLMEEGDAKRDKGDFPGALKAYSAADAIMHVPTTGLEVARVQAQLGKLLEARETLGRVLRLPAKPNEPPPFTAARKTAETMNDELASRIPSVKVVVQAPPGEVPEIVFDGEKVPQAAASVPRKVNPGAHTIVARVGTNEKSETVQVAERENKEVSFHLDAPPPPAPIADKPVETTSGNGARNVLVYGGFALAAVGVGVGSVTGLMSISKVKSIRDSCGGNTCPPDKQSEIDSAKGLGTISTVAFVAGGVGLAAAVAGLVLVPKHPETKPGDVQAVVGPSYVGLTGAF